MAEGVGEVSNREIKLGIFDRLKKVPAFSSKSSRVLHNPRGRKMDLTERAEESAARRMVEDHFKQEIDRADPMAEFTLTNNNEYFNKEDNELDEDTPACKCVPVKSDPDSTCGRKCRNVLSSTECSPTLCPCKGKCKNQRFQQNKYAKVKLIKTERTGWGLAADEDLKAGDFVIEFCGEIVPNKEAYLRAKNYKSSGLKDSYIFRLKSTNCIDATRKGSMARFINHSCESNCERRKWTVQGKDRVGIFTIVDVSAGTELTYDYLKSQWDDGGLKVRCGCGAKSCIGMLGGNSKGIQRDAYEWEDDSKRDEAEESQISSEEVEDEDEDDAPLSSFIKGFGTKKLKGVSRTKGSGQLLKNNAVPKVSPVPAPAIAKETNLEKDSPQRIAAESQVPKPIETTPLSKRHKAIPPKKTDSTPNIAALVGKLKETPTDLQLRRGIVLPPKLNPLEEEEIKVARKRAKFDAEVQMADKMASTEQMQAVNLSRVAAFRQTRVAVNKQILEELPNFFPVSEAACAEVEFAHEMESVAISDFRKVCEDILPSVKEFQNSGQEVSAVIAQKWMSTRCKKLRSSLDFHFSIIRHLAGPTFALSEARDAPPEISKL